MALGSEKSAARAGSLEVLSKQGCRFAQVEGYSVRKSSGQIRTSRIALHVLL